jgi:hypothetical protein
VVHWRLEERSRDMVVDKRADYNKGVYLLVVEPDYLPDAEVLCFQPCLYPMKYLHPRSMYTLPRGGVQRGGTPSAGSGGSIPPAGGSGGAPRWGFGGEAPEAKIAL